MALEIYTSSDTPMPHLRKLHFYHGEDDREHCEKYAAYSPIGSIGEAVAAAVVLVAAIFIA